MLNFKSNPMACGSAGALAAAALSFAPAALAQTAAADRDTVVVTGTVAPVAIDKIGSAITVVDGRLIAEQGYTYTPDVLRQVPGLAVNRTGPAGGLTQVRIRGAEGNHTLTLLDGFDISSPDQGETDFSTLLSGDIQRIEVLRGPQSGLYGSNALAGVVNIITQRRVDGTYGEASLEAGDQRSFLLQAGGGVGDGRNYGSIGLNFLTTDGYDVSPSTTAQGVRAVGVGGVAGDREGNRNTTIYLRAGREITPQLRLDGIVRLLNTKSDLDGQAFSSPIAGRSYDDASTTGVDSFFVGGVGSLSLLDGKWETTLRASYQRDERRGFGTSFSPSGFATLPLSPNGSDSTRAKATLQSTWTFGGPDFVSHLTGFAETKQETFKNPCEGASTACAPAQRLKQSRDLFGAGAQYRAEIAGQIYLTGTLRHDANDDFGDDDTYSIAGAWAIPGTGARLHASTGTGVTNPTFTEQFGFNPGTFQGNPNLKPEKADGWDIGLEQTLLEGRLSADVTYFESTLKKEIFTAFGPAPTFFATPRNRTADSERSGWEASLRFSPIEDLDIIASYTNLDATEPSGAVMVGEVRRPKEQAALDLSWRAAPALRLNAGVTHNGEQLDTDFSTFLRRPVDGYTLVRFSASYTVDPNWELYARVENATDESYQEVIGFNGSPRAAYVGVRFKETRR